MPPTIRFNTPGLFVTGTDTGVGKTVIACAIAWALRQQRGGARVAVCKPMATGCDKRREGLVNEDAEALAHFSDCRLPLDTINPIRYREPLAPAVAAKQLGQSTPWPLLQDAAPQIDAYGDALVVEGAGGVMVPLDADDPRTTWLDTGAFGLPAVVVARAGLGTLNHTAMSVKLLRDAGIKVAGVVINGYEPDEAAAMSQDPSSPSNPRWIEQMTGAKVLALVPRLPGDTVQPARANIAQGVLDAVAAADWWRVLGQ
ncbi:MAG: dethiobiotin synthase [Planctomycetota bacterium]